MSGPGAPGVYCFTLDDNIRFLEESARGGLPSLFQHPYPALLRRCHQVYGAKFQLNMYDSYAPGRVERQNRGRPHFEKRPEKKEGSK